MKHSFGSLSIYSRMVKRKICRNSFPSRQSRKLIVQTILSRTSSTAQSGSGCCTSSQPCCINKAGMKREKCTDTPFTDTTKNGTMLSSENQKQLAQMSQMGSDCLCNSMKPSQTVKASSFFGVVIASILFDKVQKTKGKPTTQRDKKLEDSLVLLVRLHVATHQAAQWKNRVSGRGIH